MNSTIKSINKTIIVGMITLVLSLIMFPMLASAAQPSAPTTIEVKGDFPGSTPATGSVVTVKCGSQTNSPVTDNKGKFSTVFNITADCNIGTIITGVFEDYYGTSTVSNSFNADTLQMRKVEAVPEIGTIAGIAGMAAVGGAILVARRRQMQNQEL